MTNHKTNNANPQQTPQKIAVLSDVHGNLPALEAVLSDAQQQGADLYWNLGDFLGYGPFVNEVVDLLFDTCTLQVIGNYDKKVLKFPDKKDKWKKSKDRRKYIAFKWAFDRLSKQNAKRLKSLPQCQPVRIGDVDLLLTHGSPDRISELIGPKTPDKRLEEIAENAAADIVLCGHTHEPFEKKVADVLFLNAGSVGRPEGSDPRAAYLMLDFSSSPPVIQFHRVAYDIERMARALHASDLPAEFAEMFRNGQNLDQVDDCVVQTLEFETPEHTQHLTEVRRFAVGCNYEAEHSEQVTRLAQQLFKALASAHHLGRQELFLLTCAAILHDIGYTAGVKAHHKTAMEMILQDTTMPLDKSQRQIVALLARYHRKSPPTADHSIYPDLSDADQAIVRWLSGILRIADGLDRSHMSLVKELSVMHTRNAVEIHCKADGSSLTAELAAAEKKADLLADILGCAVTFVVAK